jgi:hypothetical protein
MSDDVNYDSVEDQDASNEETSSEGQDQYKQLKGEFSRKTDALNEQLSALKQQNEQLQSYLMQMNQQSQAKSSSDDDIDDDLIYSDPKAYREKLAQQIREQTKKEVLGEVQTYQQTSQAKQEALSEIIEEFPELNKNDSDAFKRAKEIMAGYTEDQLSNPDTIRSIGYRAAKMAGLVPKSLRKSGNPDDFTFSGSSASHKGAKSKKKSGKLPEEVFQLAQALGVDTSDKERMARMAKSVESGNGWAPVETRRKK